MIHLIFSILSTTAILIIFKSVEKFNMDVFHVIVINYAVAFILGIIIFSHHSFDGLSFDNMPWIYFSILVGICLITMFFIIGLTTQKAGISVTSVSGKVSVIIPMLFSILYYRETLSLLKTAGIVTALFALVFSILKKQEKGIGRHYLFLPVVLFLGLGCLDSLVKFVQQEYLSNASSALFSGCSFFFAFAAGTAISITRRIPVQQFFKPNVLVAGTLLGICNFGSIFFLINALNSNIFDSSVLFGINNIAAVGLSVFAACALFREKLSALNWAGVSLSIVSISIFVHT